jgi:phosphoglycerate dehydrogenase-like enzyme
VTVVGASGDRLVCVPFDDWSDHLAPPEGLEVVVWRPGLPWPTRAAEVTFYVPEYMGPPEALTAVRELPALGVVQTLTAGYDDVLAHCPPGLVVCNAAGVHDASTAELVVGLILASLRGFADFAEGQRQGEWRHAAHPALADRRVVIVGAGSVGRAVARRLAPFEVELTLVGRSAREGVVGVDDLADLLPVADVVVLTVPLTAETHGMFDAAALARLPDGALVVNASRGAVVDTEALLAELNGGRLSAALDVTDPEPLPPGHPLWSAPRVVITPHVGGNTSAFLPRAWTLLSDQLARYAAGAPLRNVVSGG